MNKLFLSALLFFSIFVKAESIIIDGVLDEPEWANAISRNEFFKTSPFNLERSVDETVGYIF